MILSVAINPVTGTKYTLRHDAPCLSAFTKRPIGDRWVVAYTDKSSNCPIGRSFCNSEDARQEFELRTVGCGNSATPTEEGK